MGTKLKRWKEEDGARDQEKKQMELESEFQSLQKANRHLEKILEATKACKHQEVSHLNKIHRETLKNMATPPKAHQLRSQLVPRLTPEMWSQESADIQSSEQPVDNIFNKPKPPEMNEQAYEAIAEELGMVQVVPSHSKRRLWSDRAPDLQEKTQAPSAT